MVFCLAVCWCAASGVARGLRPHTGVPEIGRGPHATPDGLVVRTELKSVGLWAFMFMQTC